MIKYARTHADLRQIQAEERLRKNLIMVPETKIDKGVRVAVLVVVGLALAIICLARML